MAESMSRSDRLSAIASDLRAMAADADPPEDRALRDVLISATLLYGAAARSRGTELSLADPALTPTDAVVLCCALLRAQDLNPFDLTLWFGRVAPDPGSSPA